MHYGAYRKYNNRNPILAINCHRDLRFEYLVGNYNYKANFEFVDGPLLIAKKRGEPILLDEFNLCSQSVLINLLPIFKANLNDSIYLKGVPEKIYLTPGFFIIATGNLANEKGRNIFSSLILDEIRAKEIKTIDFTKNNSLIDNILKIEYPNVCQNKNTYEKYKISSK